MGRFVLAFLVLSGIFTVQSMAARSELKIQKIVHLSSKTEQSSIADPPASTHVADQSKSIPPKEGDHNDQSVAEAPEFGVRKMSKHHSTDKSVAGGGVIIGGLVTAIFAAVYCYIRVTRRKSSSSLSDSETH